MNIKITLKFSQPQWEQLQELPGRNDQERILRALAASWAAGRAQRMEAHRGQERTESKEAEEAGSQPVVGVELGYRDAFVATHRKLHEPIERAKQELVDAAREMLSEQADGEDPPRAPTA